MAMRMLSSVMCVGLLAVAQSAPASEDSIDGRVIQVVLPAQDVTLFYVESRAVFTVQLKTEGASVQGQRFYIGDGKVAMELVAHVTDGIFLQGVKYRQGDQFKKGAVITVRPGHKKASELKPGEVYVVLPGVSFELPAS
jgi:hypothetical protein